MATIGSCPMCQKKGVRLTEHHVVEAPDEDGKAPSIDLCEDCHKMHEKYRNYLRDECHINIDRTKK
jgi:hypothetical protein